MPEKEAKPTGGTPTSVGVAPKTRQKGTPAGEALVTVEVRQAVAFGGVRVAPAEERVGKDIRLKATRAVVPAWIADAHPDERIVEVGPAPAGAKVGPIAGPQA